MGARVVPSVFSMVVAVALFAATLPRAGASDPAAMSAAAEFSHTSSKDWINSRPLKLSSLQGAVVLVEFWTYSCENCYRSMPWLNGVETWLRPRGLRVIGVHTPEFAYERKRSGVEAKMREYGITYPVMLDNDRSYWDAMKNTAWPAFYLLDKSGRVRAVFTGKTQPGDVQADAIEQVLESLLAEPAGQ